MFNESLDVFDHNDGIVDYDADRQDQAEEGQRVDRIPEYVEPRECPNDGDRNRYQRNDRSSPSLQKNNDDDDHKKKKKRKDKK